MITAVRITQPPLMTTMKLFGLSSMLHSSEHMHEKWGQKGLVSLIATKSYIKVGI